MGDVTARADTRALEALFFVSDEPLTTAVLAQALELDRREVERRCDQLQRDARGAGRRPRAAQRRRRMAAVHPPRHAAARSSGSSCARARPGSTKAALETLAIVAYKQPVTRHAGERDPRRELRRGPAGAPGPRADRGDRARRGPGPPGALRHDARRSSSGSACRRSPRCRRSRRCWSRPCEDAADVVADAEDDGDDGAGRRRGRPPRDRRGLTPCPRSASSGRWRARATGRAARARSLIEAGRVTVDGRVATLGDKVDPAPIDGRGRRCAAQPRPEREVLRLPQAGRGRHLHARSSGAVRDLRASSPGGPAGVPRRAGSTATARGSCCSRTTASSRTGSCIRATASRRSTSPRSRAARRRGTSPRSAAGVDLEDGPARARVRRGSWTTRGDRGQLRLVMTEGRKREVRRMLAAVGLPVTPARPSAGGTGRPSAQLPPGEVRRAHRRRGRRPHPGRRPRGRGGADGSLGAAPSVRRRGREERDAGASGPRRHQDRARRRRGRARGDGAAASASCSTATASRTDDLVSVLFTVTDDLRSAFPAEAARRMGLGDRPVDVRPGDPGRGRDAEGDPDAGALPFRARPRRRSCTCTWTGRRPCAMTSSPPAERRRTSPSWARA